MCTSVNRSRICYYLTYKGIVTAAIKDYVTFLSFSVDCCYGFQYYATSPKVVGSVPDEVFGLFN
jgi:hypothetical protein